MTIAYLTHPACRLHDMGGDHPEAPARLAAIEDQLLVTGLEFAICRYDAPAATREQLCRVHDADYVERIFSRSPATGLRWLDADTAMNPHTLEAARHAAGAVVSAVDLVLGGEALCAFCAVRPPGHHAGRSAAMGFCFFNNIAVGAAHALAQYGLQRIAIADFDVHHGNGTEEIFQDEPRVLFCSSYQHPFYPFSGNTVPGPRMVKTPLDAGAGSRTFRLRVGSEWLETLDAFRPELILVSAGFDAHRQEAVADLNLNERDFGWVTRELCELANRHAGGRIISVLEGGYALPALGRSVAAHLNALLG
ncbi:MAG: histone deacetylase family protein [Gammaproteobacteria bacterium]|jgi:acetoin utilization deacetylase AcuC-like enzyme